jgi:hypothetical protein
LTTGTTAVKVSQADDRASKTGSHVSARLALCVFVVVGIYIIFAVPVLVPHQWFYLDEWDFLATRSAGNLNDLMRPHYGHWVMLPVLLYRGLFNVFGLRTYLPYQLPVDVLHVLVAALLRVIMRRAGVGPWIATAAAGLYALFGSGFEDLARGFQVTFVAALFFGLAQLILADHDGPIDRRDWLGLSAGALGLLCASGLAIIMVAVVGVAALLRRGWRVTAFHSAPLALIYGVWWLVVARHYPARIVSSPALTRLPAIVGWVKTQAVASFDAMGELPGLGAVLGGVLIVGLVLAWRSRNGEERRKLSASTALLIGATIFLVAGAWQRAAPSSLGTPSDGHYLDVLAALVLPGIAVAADAIARRWRILLPAMLALFLIGIPGNLQKLGNPVKYQAFNYQAPTQTAIRNALLAIPALPIANSLPRSSQPYPLYFSGVTYGWLLDQKRVGRLPTLPHLSAQEEANLTLSLALKQSTGSPTSHTCSPLLRPISIRAQKHESFWFSGGNLQVRYVAIHADTRPTTFYLFAGRQLTALAGPMTLMFASSDVSMPAVLCR